MTATLDIPGCIPRTVRMPLAEFLETPLLHRCADAAMCDPYDLVCEHLRSEIGLEDDPDDARLVIAEACETATAFSVRDVSLDPEDVRAFSQYLPPEPFPPYPPAAAA